jgi:ABC transporter DrrB family efflux protein
MTAMPHAERPRLTLAEALADSRVMAVRQLRKTLRRPTYISFTIAQPVIFVLLFRYVFGGAVRSIPGVPYVDYLIPGIFVQATVFGVMATSVGLAADVKSGLLERFRSLPMARSAVLVGRTLADLTRNVFVVTLMTAVGFAVGFRVHTSLTGLLLGMLLVLWFGYALSWIFATVGLTVADPETAQAAAFPVVAPLVFASSVFVPVNSMPGWLQPFAEHQPLSVVATAVRALVVGGDAIGVSTTAYVLRSLAWGVGILLVFGPIAVWRYRRAA